MLLPWKLRPRQVCGAFVARRPTRTWARTDGTVMGRFHPSSSHHKARMPPYHQFQEDKWRSLINSIWHRSERRRWQRACRFLDTLSKSRRLVLPSEPCKLRSDPTLVKEPPSKLRYRYSLHSLTHLRMHCQRIEVNLGALAGLSLVAIVVLSSRRKGQVESLNGNAS